MNSGKSVGLGAAAGGAATRPTIVERQDRLSERRELSPLICQMSFPNSSASMSGNSLSVNRDENAILVHDVGDIGYGSTYIAPRTFKNLQRHKRRCKNEPSRGFADYTFAPPGLHTAD
jgi:hypothetical protein